MNEYNDLPESSVVFPIEVAGYPNSSTSSFSHGLITILYGIGLCILMLPILLFIYLMVIGSNRVFLSSPLFLQILGGVAVIVAVVLILYLSWVYGRSSEGVMREGLGKYVFIVVMVLMMLVAFSSIGFLIYKLLLVPQDNSQEGVIASESIVINKNEASYVPYHSEVPSELKLYTLEPIEKVPVENLTFEESKKTDRYDALLKALSSHPMFKDLPKSGNIKISFFTVKDGQESIEKTFVFSNDPEIGPDIELSINTEHIDPIIADVCSGIQGAQAQGAVRYKLNKNEFIIFSKYSKIVEYKDCILGS